MVNFISSFGKNYIIGATLVQGDNTVHLVQCPDCHGVVFHEAIDDHDQWHFDMIQWHLSVLKKESS